MNVRESVLEIFRYFHVEVFSSWKPVSSRSRHLSKSSYADTSPSNTCKQEKSVPRLKNPKADLVFFSVLTAPSGVSKAEAGSPLGGRGSSSWSAQFLWAEQLCTHTRAGTAQILALPVTHCKQHVLHRERVRNSYKSSSFEMVQNKIVLCFCQ